MRPILDLRDLNAFIKKARFHSVSLASIIPSLDLGDWYATLDMQDTYFHISVIPTHRRFLRFVASSQNYQPCLGS